MTNQQLLPEKEKETPKYPISLIKSATQKAIRRNDKKSAVKTIKCGLIDCDKLHNLMRRIPVMILEDSILHPKFDELMEVVKKSGRKDYKINDDDGNLIINIIADSAEIEIRDDFLFVNPDWQKLKKETQPETLFTNMSEKERDLVRALKYRSSVGGLGFDVKLFSAMAIIWAWRFSSKEWDIEKLKSLWPKNNYDYKKIKEANKENIRLEGVDFHVSPINKIMLKKNYVKSLLNQNYQGEDHEKVLQEIMWKERSGVNLKKQLVLDRPVDWYKDDKENKFSNKEDRKKFKSIYSKLQNEYDSIAKWWVNVQEQS